jgi:sporulation protein YlmC with PRC-barrel domain
VLDTADIQRFKGSEVVDHQGDKIGAVDDVYVDEASGAPEFALVKGRVVWHQAPLRPASRC